MVDPAAAVSRALLPRMAPYVPTRLRIMRLKSAGRQISWIPGQASPSRNPYAWTSVASMLYVEQPVGTGYSQGTPTAYDETDVAKAIFGFLQQWLKVFPEMAGKNGWELDTPFIIAEELIAENMDDTLLMVPTLIVPEDCGAKGASAFTVQVAKTIMPVKTYANPSIHVYSDDVTDFAWGLSYGPVTQDIMRVVDTLSHAPRDSSPPIGFWDKVSEFNMHKNVWLISHS